MPHIHQERGRRSGVHPHPPALPSLEHLPFQECFEQKIELSRFFQHQEMTGAVDLVKLELRESGLQIFVDSSLLFPGRSRMAWVGVEMSRNFLARQAEWRIFPQ